MKRISRFDIYLTKAVLACFATFGVAICGLYVVADAAQRIVRWQYTDVSIFRFFGCMAAYYCLGLPAIVVDLLPLCWAVAVVVALFFLQRRNEITAFSTHGVSVFRVVRPILVLSLGVGVLVALGSEIVVPLLAGGVRRYEQVVAWRTQGEKLILPAGGGNTFYWIGSSDARNGRLDGVAMISYDENNQPKDLLLAKEGKWQRDGLELRDVWRPRGGFGKGGGKAEHYDRLPAPVPITRKKVLSAETPTDMSSAWGVHALMRSMPGNRFFAMVYYDHFVRPFVPLIFVLLAIPLVIGNAFTEGNSAKGILLFLLSCAGYYAVKSVCHNMGATGTLTPFQAVFLPMVVFLGIGLYLFLVIRT
ncbi:MAG: YjgP/YjgQ family permease [Planctomycetes bacterium]|nr:YjgP/YjgQ family permease [Planctomycetota bacterium]